MSTDTPIWLILHDPDLALKQLRELEWGRREVNGQVTDIFCPTCKACVPVFKYPEQDAGKEQHIMYHYSQAMYFKQLRDVIDQLSEPKS